MQRLHFMCWTSAVYESTVWRKCHIEDTFRQRDASQKKDRTVRAVGK
jgi:hypothetical protein